MSSTLVPLMEAIQAGQVTRDDCYGTRKGMWALYIWDGVEVGMQIRHLRKLRLIDAPMVGDPSITEYGEQWLREQAQT